MIVLLYRPRIVRYDRDADGQWQLKTDFTVTTWTPMPDEDTVTTYPRPGTDSRRVVSGGVEPAHRLEVLGGEFFERNGRQFLRTPSTRALDPFTALVMARQRSPDVAFWRPATTARPTLPPRAVQVGPTRQLDLFGEGGGS